jgi:hypothetical protein
MTEQKLTAEEQAIIDLLTERLGRTPTEREIALTNLGIKVGPPSGRGYILPAAPTPKPTPKPLAEPPADETYTAAEVEIIEMLWRSLRRPLEAHEVHLSLDQARHIGELPEKDETPEQSRARGFEVPPPQRPN